jgi:threonine/homoserine/homoserine lactone efflux protein
LPFPYALLNSFRLLDPAFLAASILLTVTPGPDNLFILAQGMTHGRRAALPLAWGMCCGISVHALAATFGIAALLRGSPTAFAVIQIVGAAYLLWVAVCLWREAGRPFALGGVGRQAQPTALLFARGFLMNVLNPKVALFFLAFFPQFIAADDAHPTRTTLLLSAAFFAQALVIFSLFAVLSGWFGRALSGPRLRPALLRLTAVGLAAVALRLAVGF